MERNLNSPTDANDPPKLVFWSSRESINKQVPSVTAVIETIVATSVYLYAAIYSELYWTLIASAIAAPLVLLRSEESVSLGIKWFSKWQESWSSPQEITKYSIVVATVSTGCACILSYVLLTIFFTNAEAWKLFLYSWAVVWTSICIGSTIQVCIVAGVTPLGTLILALTAGAFAIVANHEIPSVAGALVGTVAVVIPVLRDINSTSAAIPAIPETLRAITIIPIYYGHMLGAFLFSIVVRICATLRCFIPGLRALPDNFRRLVFCTSPLQEPEMVPGLTRTTEFTLRGLWQRFAEARRLDAKDKIIAYLVFAPTFLVWFFPAWFYRLTLKSTFWFWWPLAFLGSELVRAKHPELFRQQILETLWAKASIVLAVLTILIFFIVNFLLGAVIFEANPFLSVFGYVFLIDWTDRPWQTLALLAAILSIVIVFWIDSSAREYAYALRTSDSQLIIRVNRKFGWIERILRIRFLLVLMFWFIVGGHAILYFNSLKCWIDIPQRVQTWAGSIYGERLPQRRCISRNQKALLHAFTFFAST